VIFFRKRFKLCRPDDLGSTGGGVVDVAAPVADVSAPAPAPAPAAPATMFEAIDRGLSASAPAVPEPIAGQPRDEFGRFTFRDAAGQAVDADGVAAPDQAAALAAQAAAPAAALAPVIPEDPTKMPEGLGPKAQERFQALANGIKERDAKLAEYEPAVNAIREVWQENQVQPEQFEQAMSIIGMMNRGDFAGALQALQPQLQMLSAHAGQSVSVDPLANFPDLQAQVQQLMMTPEAAAEVARARAGQSLNQQHAQRQQQVAQQRQQQEQQAQQAEQLVKQATGDIDAFCRQMQTTDIDYAAIEAQLLPGIKDLVQDVPPARWAALVKQQYTLIKNAVGAARRTAPAPTSQPLRPTGQTSGVPRPNTMFAAMFPNG